MKKAVAVLLLTTALAYSNNEEKIQKPVNLYGDTTYTREGTQQSLVTTLNLEYKFKLHEPSHKKWQLFLGGKLSLDYDSFGRELKKNAFTVIGIDF